VFQSLEVDLLGSLLHGEGGLCHVISNLELDERRGWIGKQNLETLDDLLQRLGIDEDEIDDLVFKETDLPKEGIKWMALAHVHTTNFFSLQTFEQHMRVAWSPAKEVTITLLNITYSLFNVIAWVSC
jgi:hypothetical protein